MRLSPVADDMRLTPHPFLHRSLRSTDNLLARLGPLFPASSLLRLGHPARISPLLAPHTLAQRTSTSHEADIVQDVKAELEAGLGALGKKKGEKGWVGGRERGKRWEDVRELRKE